MSDVSTDQRVTCHRCRYWFPVQVQPAEDWRIEAQCPCCQCWASFAVADTNLPRPDPQELAAASRRLAERVWLPIKQHHGHPAIAWIDRVGNGFFEDDRSEPCWPIPWTVYRFTRRADAAYIWQEETFWWVRSWHSTRGRGKPPEPAEVFSFEAALDWLVR